MLFSGVVFIILLPGMNCCPLASSASHCCELLCFSRNISPTFGALSYFWQTLEELECHGPVMSEQTRVELEQKIDEARESIRKAEVRKASLGTSISYHGMVCAAAV